MVFGCGFNWPSGFGLWVEKRDNGLLQCGCGFNLGTSRVLVQNGVSTQSIFHNIYRLQLPHKQTNRCKDSVKHIQV